MIAKNETNKKYVFDGDNIVVLWTLCLQCFGDWFQQRFDNVCFGHIHVSSVYILLPESLFWIICFDNYSYQINQWRLGDQEEQKNLCSSSRSRRWRRRLLTSRRDVAGRWLSSALDNIRSLTSLLALEWNIHRQLCEYQKSRYSFWRSCTWPPRVKDARCQCTSIVQSCFCSSHKHH